MPTIKFNIILNVEAEITDKDEDGTPRSTWYDLGWAHLIAEPEHREAMYAKLRLMGVPKADIDNLKEEIKQEEKSFQEAIDQQEGTTDHGK